MLIALDWLVLGDIGLEVTPNGRSRILGGAAARLAAHGAAFGMKVALVGKLGDDDRGLLARDMLHRLGVDLRWLRLAPGLQTTMWHEVADRPPARHIERAADLALRLDEVPPPSAARARLTLVSGFSLLVEPARSAVLRSLETAAGRGGRSALQVEADRLWSLNPRTTRRVLEPALAAAHSVALSASDARVLFGTRTSLKDALKETAQMGPRLVFLEGDDGSCLLQEGPRLHVVLKGPADGGRADRFAGPAAFWASLSTGKPPRKAAVAAARYAAGVRRAGAPRQAVHL